MSVRSECFFALSVAAARGGVTFVSSEELREMASLGLIEVRGRRLILGTGPRLWAVGLAAWLTVCDPGTQMVDFEQYAGYRVEGKAS